MAQSSGGLKQRSTAAGQPYCQHGGLNAIAQHLELGALVPSLVQLQRKLGIAHLLGDAIGKLIQRQDLIG